MNPVNPVVEVTPPSTANVLIGTVNSTAPYCDVYGCGSSSGIPVTAGMGGPGSGPSGLGIAVSPKTGNVIVVGSFQQYLQFGSLGAKEIYSEVNGGPGAYILSLGKSAPVALDWN
jgi:hypothetical protein